VRVCAGRRRHEWRGREARVSGGVCRWRSNACRRLRAEYGAVIWSAAAVDRGVEQRTAACVGRRRRSRRQRSVPARAVVSGEAHGIEAPAAARGVGGGENHGVEALMASEVAKQTASKRGWALVGVGGERVSAVSACCQRRAWDDSSVVELWRGMAVDGGVRGTEASSKIWTSLECGVRRASQRLPGGGICFFPFVGRWGSWLRLMVRHTTSVPV
jgi:hypothetical protein